MTAPLPADAPDEGLGTYAVTVEDIARELASAFPSGFSADTTPSRDLVRRWVVDADNLAQMFVGSLGFVPDATTLGASLVRQLIRDTVIVKVMRAVYALNGVADMASAMAPWSDSLTSVRSQITLFAAEVNGASVQPSRVRASFPTRTPLVDDAQLSGDRRIRSAT